MYRHCFYIFWNISWVYCNENMLFKSH